MPRRSELTPIPAKRELLAQTENRVLVLGSRLSGAFTLADSFQEYLRQRGIAEPRVAVLRDAGLIELAILGRESIEEGRKHPCLPKGVILLPTMRQYFKGRG